MPKKKPISALQKRKNNVRSKYHKNRADKAWGELIHQAGCCAVGDGMGEACAGNLEAHHIISRAVVSQRHKPINGILLCSLHHKFSRKCSPHASPFAFAEWLNKHRPEQAAYEREYRHYSAPPLSINYKLAYETLQTLLGRE